MMTVHSMYRYLCYFLFYFRLLYTDLTLLSSSFSVLHVNSVSFCLCDSKTLQKGGGVYTGCQIYYIKRANEIKTICQNRRGVESRIYFKTSPSLNYIAYYNDLLVEIKAFGSIHTSHLSYSDPFQNSPCDFIFLASLSLSHPLPSLPILSL